MAKVLITGVAGFIAARLGQRLMTEGHDVIGVDDLSSGHRENVPAGMRFIEGDLADPAVVERLERCDWILHLAGQSSGEISFDDPVADLRKNTVSTLNLIRHGIRTGAERIVYASSMSVYGSVPDAPTAETVLCAPLSCYGVGKLAAEGYLRAYQKHLPFVAMRMFNVYGPGQDLANLRQGMVSIFLAQAIAPGRIEVKGSLQRFRDIIHVDDVVEAWVRAARSPEALNRTLNVATGVRTTVEQLLQRICAQVPGSSFFVQGSTPGDQSGIYADTTQLRAVLGLRQFRGLDEGLPEFVEWARARLARKGAVS
jgi:UDP-glucose 4-epimerase